MGSILTIVGALCSLAAFVCWVIIMIAAFQESVGQGFLCLCIPLYIFYFAFACYQSEKKGMIVGIMVGGWILSIILQLAGGGLGAGLGG